MHSGCIALSCSDYGLVARLALMHGLDNGLPLSRCALGISADVLQPLLKLLFALRCRQRRLREHRVRHHHSITYVSPLLEASKAMGADYVFQFSFYLVAAHLLDC